MTTTFCPYVSPRGLITYHDPATSEWVENATSIPERALEVLPEDVRRRTEKRIERFCK